MRANICMAYTDYGWLVTMIAATRLQKYYEPSSIWAPDASWCGMELDDWHDSALLVTELDREAT